jgi:hypothetical protein
VTLAADDLGLVGSLGKALGVFHGDGSHNPEWFGNPQRFLGTILADEQQRDALVAFVDEALGGEERETDASGVTWLPIVSLEDPRLTFSATLDTAGAFVDVGLGVELATSEPQVAVRASVPLFRLAKSGGPAVTDHVLLGKPGARLSAAASITITPAGETAAGTPGQPSIGAVGLEVQLPTDPATSRPRSSASPSSGWSCPAPPRRGTCTSSPTASTGWTTPCSTSCSRWSGRRPTPRRHPPGARRRRRPARAAQRGRRPGLPGDRAAGRRRDGDRRLGPHDHDDDGRPPGLARPPRDAPRGHPHRRPRHVRARRGRAGARRPRRHRPDRQPAPDAGADGRPRHGRRAGRDPRRRVRRRPRHRRGPRVPRPRAVGRGRPRRARAPGDRRERAAVVRADTLRLGFALDAERRLVFVLAADQVRLGNHDYAVLDLTSPDALMDAAGNTVAQVADTLLDALAPADDLVRLLLGVAPPAGGDAGDAGRPGHRPARRRHRLLARAAHHAGGGPRGARGRSATR